MIRPVVSTLVLAAVALTLIDAAAPRRWTAKGDSRATSQELVPQQVSRSATDFKTNAGALSVIPSAARITVLCAAGLSNVMEELRDAFESTSPIEIDFSFKGSAQLVAFYRIGGSGDLLIAADVAYHRDLVDERLCDPPIVIGEQFPCLITDRNTPRPESLTAALLSEKFRTSIPMHHQAAIGRRVAQIVGIDQYQAFSEAAFVTRENVTQVATDVDQGITDVGVVWSATAISFFNLTTHRYEKLTRARSEIGVSILSSTKHRPAASAFAKFLTQSSAKLILEAHGYAEPLPNDIAQP